MRCITRIIILTTLALTGACASSASKTVLPSQQTFSTPDAAVSSLVDAVRADSPEAIHRILGPDADSILHTGDTVQDRHDTYNFLRLYDGSHQIVDAGGNSRTLVIGDRQWPFPIPLVCAGGQWYFDTVKGREEILNRRIGGNELATMQVCRAIVDAENDYRRISPEGVSAFAGRFFSEANRKNGLFWPTAEGETPSPLGPLAARAAAEGYVRSTQGSPRPYHGYFYHILTAQGPSAPGGAKSYIVAGQQTGGFAIVAWPAAYGRSGIMTFIVNQSGIIYQRDMGKDTANLASTMQSFDPDSRWTVCEE